VPPESVLPPSPTTEEIHASIEAAYTTSFYIKMHELHDHLQALRLIAQQQMMEEKQSGKQNIIWAKYDALDPIKGGLHPHGSLVNLRRATETCMAALAMPTDPEKQAHIDHTIDVILKRNPHALVDILTHHEMSYSITSPLTKKMHAFAQQADALKERAQAAFQGSANGKTALADYITLLDRTKKVVAEMIALCNDQQNPELQIYDHAINTVDLAYRARYEQKTHVERATGEASGRSRH
jgi:hypothetical protein